jgi:hypothetical protein
VKINDITEGLYDTLAGVSQRVKQSNWATGGAKDYYKDYYAKKRADQQKAIAQHQADQQSAKQFNPNPTRGATPTTHTVDNPEEGSVLLVQAANGDQYFKSFKGTWHLKGKAPNDFSVGGTKITNPADITALDALLPQAKLIGVKPATNEPSDAWVYDERKTKLLARRGKK